MIHKAFKKTHIAQRYYEIKTGEKLSPERARKRFEKDKNIQNMILVEVFTRVMDEQEKLIIR